MQFAWICLGGALGTGARYLVSGWTLRAFGTSFPYGTLAVNVAGSLLLAFLMQVGLSTDALRPTLRLALTTGVLGGFTTYSTFNYEALRYLQEGAWWLAGSYVLATLVGCLLGGALGFAVASRLVGG